jgi:hypothetical protein
VTTSHAKNLRGDPKWIDWFDVGRLCERPGCSESGAASYGMVPEDLLFWVDTFHPSHEHDTGVLCRRHADTMVVPRGWTLDDRREPQPRLFRSSADVSGAIARPRRPRSRGSLGEAGRRVEQLELVTDGPETVAAIDAVVVADPSWVPDFDTDDDLDGLLQVRSPLLARAFRGTDRAR